MRGQYEFDPAVAELEFGFGAGGAPAWEINLGDGHKLALRGRIDRIDLYRETGGNAWCVVMDYKSGRRKLDRVLVEHGVQLQLLGYLAALRRWPDPRALIGAGTVGSRRRFLRQPARQIRRQRHARRGAGRRRGIALSGLSSHRTFQRGRLAEARPPSDVQAGDQFNYRRNQDGSLHKGSVEALPRPEFEALLDRVETQLTEMGRAIYAGVAKVDPYRKGGEMPCQYCDYRAVCRIDPWTHRYRVLRALPQEANA